MVIYFVCIWYNFYSNYVKGMKNFIKMYNIGICERS